MYIYVPKKCNCTNDVSRPISEWCRGKNIVVTSIKNTATVQLQIMNMLFKQAPLILESMFLFSDECINIYI